MYILITVVRFTTDTPAVGAPDVKGYFHNKYIYIYIYTNV